MNKKYEYTYNADGLRTGKTVDGVKHEYYLSGSKILAETRETGGTKKLIKYYYDDTGVVGFNLDGTDYYFAKSMQGDVEKIYSASGELKAEYSYDSWGKCTITKSVSGIDKNENSIYAVLANFCGRKNPRKRKEAKYEWKQTKRFFA